MKNISCICKKITLAILIAALSLTAAGCSSDTGSSLQAKTETSGTSELAPESIPDYSGCSFTTVNGNVPFFSESEMTTEPFEEYSEQDSLGRCRTAYANICEETMPDEEREDIGMIKPSGWHTAEYTDIIEGDYLYNRCHLIGFQLAGENANEQNLITGTRWFNVEGMLPFENAVADYVDDTGNHVLYRVTPVYEGSDLVASGVEIEAQSVEDDSISFNVYVYNIQPGISIDYSIGESSLDSGYESEIEAAEEIQYEAESEIDEIVDGSASEVSVSDPSYGSQKSSDPQDNSDSRNNTEKTYIINTNTKKFHLPDCPSVKEMSANNKQSFSGTRSELIDSGYSPCGNCRP